MLQQTTVGTVTNHFERFLKKYPTIKSLASISEEQIVTDWSGLGYYRRARNLLKAAKAIQNNFNGVIPIHFEQLISIGGIGPYTANALIAIGADKKALCVDANLERVLARYYGLQVVKGPKLQKEIYQLFESGKISSEIEAVGARIYNESLMDLGRSICKARSASCEICPIAKDCQALKSGSPLSFPLKAVEVKKQKPLDLKLLRLIVEKDKKYLVYKKSSHQWLSGQYEIPTFILESEDENLIQYKKLPNCEVLLNLPSFVTGITKYKISNYVLYANLNDLKTLGLNESDFVWKSSQVNLSTASMKALKLLND
jgi:A/G-specific adenine glycosylase